MGERGDNASQVRHARGNEPKSNTHARLVSRNFISFHRVSIGICPAGSSSVAVKLGSSKPHAVLR